MKHKYSDVIKRLDELGYGIQQIVDFLLFEKLIKDEDVIAISKTADKHKMIMEYILKLKQEDKIQLLTFDWVIFPIEKIRIYIVTDRNSKEFEYKWY